jgi:hypothetical protein
MQERIYNIRISPEVINNKFLQVIWSGDGYSINVAQNPCCDEEIPPITGVTTGNTFVYVPMPDLLSGGTNGNSLLDITVPIFLSENTVDVGYYNVFDGFLLQKDTMLNFLFSATTSNPYTYNIYNTSEVDIKNYLSFSSYIIDWGDGSSPQTITDTAPTPYTHDYAGSGTYNITMSGLSPWGYNIITKKINIPFTDIVIDNPNGEAFFVPASGNWSGIPISYDYIYHYDEECNETIPCCEFTTIPFLVTGYTKSSISDLQQYGVNKYVIDRPVSGASGSLGFYRGVGPNGIYTAYTINDIDYYDYSDGTTLFVVNSSGCTSENLVCSAITKNEVLMNVISEAEVQSNIFIERGKNSALEMIERLGEISSVGDLEEYGYKFYNIIKI